MVVVVGADVKFWTFAGVLPKLNKCEQGGGGQSFGDFVSVMIECPLKLEV